MQEAAPNPVCSVCGQPLNGRGSCLACLLRAGLEDSDERGDRAGDTVFGDFEIEKDDDGSLWELGRGGMGVTYRAFDKVLRRPVALKVIDLPSGAGESRVKRERFLREARSAAALKHSNIAGVFRFGASAGGDRCYCAMELVEGETLEARVRRDGPLKLLVALEVGIQVARALRAAAQRGLVHRDLKPGNIMLAESGDSAQLEVKVIDFGLAKAVSGLGREMELTHGAFVGTPAFASPEQFAGNPVDARSDIYALGVTLWFAMTGRLPFEGETIEEIRQQQAQQELPLDQLDSAAVPAEVVDLLRSCLAVDRAKRFPSAGELLQALESCRAAAAGRGRSRGLASRLAAIAIVALALVAWRMDFKTGPPSRSVQVEDSIAVLPLENLSGDPSHDVLADEMTESVITELAKVGALRVISRPAVKPYKGTTKPLPEIARELNVDTVLTGSVTRSGQHVRIAVQLIHAGSDRSIWTETYEQNLRDVLALQRQVTRDIVREIKIKLTPQEQGRFEKVRQVDPEAYDHYLRGKFHLHRQTREHNEAGIAALENAVAKDATFAEAFAELAQAYVWKLFLFAPGDRDLPQKAFVAVEKALSLDPNLAVAYLARGRLLWTPANHFPHVKAIREYRRALALNPNLDEARNQLALVYCHIGAFDEALRESYEAVNTNPNNNLAQFRIGQTLNFQGKYEEGFRVLRAIPREVNPALVGYQTAWALYNLGRKEEAAVALEQLLTLHPEDSGGLYTSLEAVLAASAGQEELAEQKINSAIEKGRGFGHFHHTAYQIACAYALMDKHEQGIKWLKASADDGFPCYPLFEQDANLDRLRHDPRFAEFLAAQKQQWESYMSDL
jgi:serine/threonine protein kinase/Flp pilus assembly protein TadD